MIRRSQQDSGRVQGLSCWIGVDRKVEDPEISRTSLSTNFLGGRTFRIRPPGPQKSGPDPRIPEKSGPDPRIPGNRPFSRIPGSWTPGNRDFPRRWTRFPRNGRFPGFRGGSEKSKAAPRHPDCSRKRPITTYATPMGFVPFWANRGTPLPPTDEPLFLGVGRGSLVLLPFSPKS